MKTIGLLLIFFGIATGMYAFALDPTVDADNVLGMDRVHNLGLLNDKQNILFVAGVICIMGSIFVAGAYRPPADWRVQNVTERSVTEQKS